MTISFSPTGDGKVEAPAAPSSEDALEAAHKLVMTEEKLREQAKHLAAVEKVCLVPLLPKCGVLGLAKRSLASP